VNATVWSPRSTRSTKRFFVSTWLERRRPLPKPPPSYSGGFQSSQCVGPVALWSSSTGTNDSGSCPVTVAACSTGLPMVAEQQTQSGRLSALAARWPGSSPASRSQTRFSRRNTSETWLPNTPRYSWTSSTTTVSRRSKNQSHRRWAWGRMP
jgi:hypothetical protein